MGGEAIGKLRARRLARRLLDLVDGVQDAAAARQRGDAAAAVRQEHRLDGAAAALAEYLASVLDAPRRAG